MFQSLNQNVHVLLAKEDLTLLKQHAKRSKVSIAELIRQAVRQVYGGTDRKKKQSTFKRLSMRNELVMEDWSQVKKELLRRYA